jgi:antitoxin (DNA-binding transcriptional repressor) of toxin-antitoxin stability system
VLWFFVIARLVPIAHKRMREKKEKVSKHRVLVPLDVICSGRPSSPHSAGESERTREEELTMQPGAEAFCSF